MGRPRIIIADTDIGYIIPLQLKFVEDFLKKSTLKSSHLRSTLTAFLPPLRKRMYSLYRKIYIQHLYNDIILHMCF